MSTEMSFPGAALIAPMIIDLVGKAKGFSNFTAIHIVDSLENVSIKGFVVSRLILSSPLTLEQPLNMIHLWPEVSLGFRV